MDKPEFLTGEVKSFEEEIIILDSTEELITDYGHELFLEMHRFYTQPFTPSLITELFEGWEDCSKGEDLLYENEFESEYALIPEDISGETQLGSIDGGDYLPLGDFIYPRTLNDFINDCERSGITLRWKD
jgi:hypothetical protein